MTTAATRSLEGISVSALREMDPALLLDALERVIRRKSHTYFVYGFEFEDKRQEMSLCVYRCQQNYDPDNHPGFKNRSSSFINYLLVAIDNTLCRMADAGRRQSRVVSEVACARCGLQKALFARGVCLCGSARFKPVYAAPVVSLELALDDIPTFFEPFTTDSYDFEDRDLITRLIRTLPRRDWMDAFEGIEAGILPERIKASLRSYLDKHVGILPVSRCNREQQSA